MGKKANMVEISSKGCFPWIGVGFCTFRNSAECLAFMGSILTSLSKFWNRNDCIVHKRENSKEDTANPFITSSCSIG